MPEITVGYERKFSDGNYGSEGLSVSITIPVEVAEITTETLLDKAHYVRRTVLSFLAGSSAPRVASGASYELNPPPPRRPEPEPPPDDPEDLPY